LSILINEKWEKTGDCFIQQSSKLKFIGRTKPVLPNSLKDKERIYDKR
jgi:hypothetical protein